MIEYVTGNLLDSSAEALVNTVNTVGVMGKGIALQFKKRFPHNYKVYEAACKARELETGHVLVVKDGDAFSQKTIINFPTKKHWRQPSKYEYIEAGINALKQALVEHKIQSVAIPPLGSGNGGLNWEEVRAMLESGLGGLDVAITIYSPNEQIKAQLQKETAPSKAKLTPARAMLLHLMYQYEAYGDLVNLVVINKLAYLLQQTGEPLRLNFEKYYYGPYSVQLNHVLQYLNGTFIIGMEQNTAQPFDDLYLQYDRQAEVKDYIDSHLSADQRERLASVGKLIHGFTSSYTLELLATVAYLWSEEQVQTLQTLKTRLAQWSDRKATIFSEGDLNLALNHLQSKASHLAFG